MKRLQGFKTLFTFLLLSSAVLNPGASASPGGRLTLPLVADWKFQKGSDDAASANAFDDSAWESITVPHTWNVEDGNQPNYFRGEGWYRRRFDLAANWAGKRILLQFDGANRRAEVFLNGHRIGQHRGGYARFRFDITRWLRPGQNVLAVRVNNATNDNMIPVSGDYTFFGGLYRAVSIIAVDPVHIDLLDHASPGVFIIQKNVSADFADLEARVLLANDLDTAAEIQVRTVITDASGKTVATAERSAALPPFGRGESVARVELAQPHLWNAQADPYLYQVTTSLSVGGVVRDSSTVPLGLRYYTVDREKGLFLNGHYLDLRGVNRHQERAGKGWAVSDQDEDEDMSIIEEMGCTFVRQSHYQQSQHWNDLGDRRGMIMWAELAYGNDARDNPEFLENAKEQLRELIRQNFQHPAIFFWSIGNETFVRDPKVTPPDTNDRILRALAAVAREEDPTRLSTYASNGSTSEPRAGISDVVGFNQYFGWYHATPGEFAAWLDQQHANRPDLRMGMSEFGAGANIAQHDDPAHQPVAVSQFHPEEWQATYHEAYWETFATRPWVWCKTIWAIFDFASAGRKEGGTPGRNDKGLVTMDRATRKDAYYLYQANWSSRPMVHLTSQRYIDRAESQTTVKVYSNLEMIELRLNGASLGSKTSSNRIFLWPDVKLIPGENQVEVHGSKDGHDFSEHCIWNYKPAVKPDGQAAPEKAAPVKQ